MISFRRPLLAALLVGSGLACMDQPGETMRLRHNGQDYQVTLEAGPEGPRLDGPDLPLITLLLSRPDSGFAPDTLEDDLLWLYANDQEREQVVQTLSQRKRKKMMLPPVPPKDGLEASCYGTWVELYRNDNFGGDKSVVAGEFFDPDLRSTGWDNQISSLKFYGTQVLLYEHLDGKGHNLSLIPQYDVIGSGDCVQEYGEFPSLGKFIMYWRPVFRGQVPVSWNDQATSMMLLDAR